MFGQENSNIRRIGDAREEAGKHEICQPSSIQLRFRPKQIFLDVSMIFKVSLRKCALLIKLWAGIGKSAPEAYLRHLEIC